MTDLWTQGNITQTQAFYITEVTPLKMPGNRKNVSLIVGYETKEKQFKKAIINLIYFKYIVITCKW